MVGRVVRHRAVGKKVCFVTVDAGAQGSFEVVVLDGITADADFARLHGVGAIAAETVSVGWSVVLRCGPDSDNDRDAAMAPQYNRRGDRVVRCLELLEANRVVPFPRGL